MRGLRGIASWRTLPADFGILALLLASIGLYGVMCYLITRRIPELGVRMALGASPARIVHMVLRESFVWVGVGLVGGLALVAATSRLLAGILFGIPPGGPMTVAIATLVLVVVAAYAGYLPARRAEGVDPMVALRCE
jgi:ABC-type antimicrobial peptide transport system permease subunit